MASFPYEHKNPLEQEADRILSDDTKRRGSGITRYPSNPGREVLTEDFSIYGDTQGVWDEYPCEEEKLLEDNIRARYLAQMLSKLSPRQQQVMELVVIRGWSERQAGEELGIKGGTVNDYVHTALDRLRKVAGEDEIFKALFPGLVGDE